MTSLILLSICLFVSIIINCAFIYIYKKYRKLYSKQKGLLRLTMESANIEYECIFEFVVIEKSQQNIKIKVIDMSADISLIKTTKADFMLIVAGWYKTNDPNIELFENKRLEAISDILNR